MSSEIKISEIRPVVESLTIILDGIKHYDDNGKIDFEGRVSFNVDVETGQSCTCINVGKFKFSTGSGFWMDCFKGQTTEIKRLCKKAVKDYKKNCIKEGGK